MGSKQNDNKLRKSGIVQARNKYTILLLVAKGRLQADVSIVFKKTR